MRMPTIIPVFLLLACGAAAALGSSIGNKMLGHMLEYYSEQIGLESKYPLYNGIKSDPRVFLV